MYLLIVIIVLFTSSNMMLTNGYCEEGMNIKTFTSQSSEYNYGIIGYKIYSDKNRIVTYGNTPICIWDFNTQELIESISPNGSISFLDITDNEEIIAYVTPGGYIYFVDIEQKITQHFASVAISLSSGPRLIQFIDNDSKLIIVSCNRIYIFDVMTKDLIKEHILENDEIRATVFNNGKYIYLHNQRAILKIEDFSVVYKLDENENRMPSLYNDRLYSPEVVHEKSENKIKYTCKVYRDKLEEKKYNELSIKNKPKMTNTFHISDDFIYHLSGKVSRTKGKVLNFEKYDAKTGALLCEATYKRNSGRQCQKFIYDYEIDSFALFYYDTLKFIKIE